MKVIYHFPVFRFSLLLCLFCFFSSADTLAQKKKKGSSPDNCQLDEAKRWYEMGDLEKIEGIETCVSDPKSMSREKRIEALQLITESYLYRDKIGAADKSFRNLLSISPLYEADSTDPINSYDLIYLSRTFSRRPIFSMYFAAGANFSLVEQLENYGTDNTSGLADHEGYLREVEIGFTGAIGFEVPLIYNFELALDATFGYRTFAYGDSMYISVNPANPTDLVYGNNSELNSRAGAPLLYSTLIYKENQFWIDVPLILRYNLSDIKGFLPYIYVGVAGNFLLNANLGAISRTTQTENAITSGGESTPEKTILITPDAENGTPSLRTMANVSFVAGAGIKKRVGSDFIFFDFRYTRMFLNNVDINNRYANNELLYQYGHVDNDFRMDNFALTFGYTKAFYKPRKKHQHNPLIIGRKYNKWLEKERNYAKKETDEDLKRELNSAIKDMERQKPSLIEDVQKGKTKGDKMIGNKQKEFGDYKNKRVKVEVKYE
jgi:hypothetical protein